MKKALQLMLLFIVITVCSQAQRRLADSIIGALKQPMAVNNKVVLLYRLAFQLADIKPDSALVVGKQALALSIQTKNDNDLQASSNSLGWAYYRSGEYDSAETCFQKAITLCQKLNLKKDEGSVRLNMVTLFETKKNFVKALTYALPITALFEKEKYEEGKAFTEKEIGIIYREMGEFEKSRNYLLSALNGFQKMGDTTLYMAALPSLASIYLLQKNYSLALYNYRQVLAYEKKHPNINEAFAFENIGEAFFQEADSIDKKRNTDSALYNYQQAKEIFEKIGGISDVAYEEINIGKCFGNLGNYTEAVKYFTRSLEVFTKNKDLEFQLEVSDHLAETYNLAKNFSLAYKYLRERNTLKDSIDAGNNREKIAAMFAQYETDKKDRTILLLNTQQKLDQQQISRQHIITIFLVSLALFAVFIGLILWNRRTIKQKLEEVEMRNQLSSDLHDDIGSSLSSILLLSNMAAQNKDNAILHNTLLDKINTNAKEVIDRMSDIVWTMNPKYDEGESLRERIENYITRLKEITIVTINSNIDKKIDQYHFSMELRKNIFLIIKEAMNNALKYAGATLLQLDLITAEKTFELVIRDNGTGFNKEETSVGNGCETMISRAKASGGECKILSAIGKGTEVKATIPIPHIR